MSGQNKRINNSISAVNQIIKDYKLYFIQPIRFIDENDIYDAKEEKYEEVINRICYIQGELRGLTLPSANRTPQKQEEYRNQIDELEKIKKDMQIKKNQQY